MDKDAKIELVDVTLGPVTLKELLVQWSENGNDFDLTVAGDVLLPGGWEVSADLVFVNEVLDDITVSANLGEGIAIGDTGLFITELAGSIKNLDNPSALSALLASS